MYYGKSSNCVEQLTELDTKTKKVKVTTIFWDDYDSNKMAVIRAVTERFINTGYCKECDKEGKANFGAFALLDYKDKNFSPVVCPKHKQLIEDTRTPEEIEERERVKNEFKADIAIFKDLKGIIKPTVKEKRNMLDKFKKIALKRDKYTCQKCGHKDITNLTLCVHHIKHKKSNPELTNDLTNLITLCANCHSKTHREK
jgi:hypothetical protein